MVTDFSKKDVTDGIKYLSYSLNQIDDLTINCVSAYTTSTYTDVTETLKPYNIFLNLLYNAGFMTTDVLNVVFFQPSANNIFWYEVPFYFGDFFIRFFYSD